MHLGSAFNSFRSKKWAYLWVFLVVISKFRMFFFFFSIYYFSAAACSSLSLRSISILSFSNCPKVFSLISSLSFKFFCNSISSSS